MPYVDSSGIKIYYETEGKGPPLLLHHGLMSNTEDYKTFGYTKALGKQFKLILMDARGHGKSDKPYNQEAYSMEKMVNDILAVLDALDITRTHFLGYSFGGKMGLGALKYASDRLISLIVGGMGAIEPDSEEEVRRTSEQVKSFGKGLEQRVEVIMSYGLSEKDARAYVEGIDWRAMTALRLNTDHIGFDDVLPDLAIPCMFYAGTEDYFYSFAKDTAELIPDSEFVSLAGLDHFEGFSKSELVLPHIIKFLEKHR